MVRGISSVRANRRGANAMRRSAEAYAVVYNIPTGARTFTAPASGWYRLVLWGGGGPGAGGGPGVGVGGGSGAYVEAVRYLAKGQTVTFSVGLAGENTTATLPSGEVLTAGGSTASAGGTATAKPGLGDIVLDGSTGGTNAPGAAGAGTAGGAGDGATGAGLGGGAGAPGNGSHRGGDGGGLGAGDGVMPGGGGAFNGGSAGRAAAGAALVYRVRIAG